LGDSRPLRYLDAVPWQCATESEDLAPIGQLMKHQPNGEFAGPALLRFKVGAGRIDRWSVNIPKTIVGLQQGLSPVLEDGAPAPDGTGPFNDGILKAEDVLELDWQWDRKQ